MKECGGPASIGRKAALQEYDFLGRSCWRCKRALPEFQRNIVHLYAGLGEKASGIAIHPDAIGLFEGPKNVPSIERKEAVPGGAFVVKREIDFSKHKFKMLCKTCINAFLDRDTVDHTLVNLVAELQEDYTDFKRLVLLGLAVFSTAIGTLFGLLAG